MSRCLIGDPGSVPAFLVVRPCLRTGQDQGETPRSSTPGLLGHSMASRERSKGRLNPTTRPVSCRRPGKKTFSTNSDRVISRSGGHVRWQRGDPRRTDAEQPQSCGIRLGQVVGIEESPRRCSRRPSASTR